MHLPSLGKGKQWEYLLSIEGRFFCECHLILTIYEIAEFHVFCNWKTRKTVCIHTFEHMQPV